MKEKATIIRGVDVMCGTALSKEFISYCKEFVEIKIKSKSDIYFKVYRKDLLERLKTNKPMIIKYRYFDFHTLFIDSISFTKK